MTIEIAAKLLIFLAGLLLGNWLAIGRDRRKEFNDTAEKITTELLNEKQALDIHGDFFYSISDTDYFHFRTRLPWWQRKSFDSALKKSVVSG